MASSAIGANFYYIALRILALCHAPRGVVPPFFFQRLCELASTQPFTDRRVKVGPAWDNWFLPREQIVDLFTKARGWGTKLITSHHA
jgi:hypothetical protein